MDLEIDMSFGGGVEALLDSSKAAKQSLFSPSSLIIPLCECYSSWALSSFPSSFKDARNSMRTFPSSADVAGGG